jgi:hypothetical protein
VQQWAAPLVLSVMFRRAVVLSSLLLSVACSRDPVEPPNAVLGSFGGRGTELVASADSVRVRFVCGVAVFGQPILPEADGRFALAPVLVPARNGTAALAIKGVVSSGQIAFDAVALSSSGEVTTTHHVVQLDRPADYSGMACLADGND